MDHGHIVEDSPTEQFFTLPRAERAQEFLAKIIH
jgi:glutamate/aspartate transport system ATP-binding protein